MVETKRINFTKRTLEDLDWPQPGKRQERYYDTKARGLFLLVTEARMKTFYVRRKVKGKSELFLLGRFPELSVEQARAKAGGFHAAVTDGKNAAQAKRAEKAELTVENSSMSTLNAI